MNAVQQIIEDQIDGNTMETRIARLESDVGCIKGAIDEVKGDIKGASAAISTLAQDVNTMKATLPHLATRNEVSAVYARINSLEANIIKWVAGIVMGTAAAALSIAKFMS